ncbi:MAG: hypothetical protein NT051_07100 [Candidatus Micrarchaeota archaeon]|nr:hypothetical protein [Candidatus Micrarchaeota archaeon]
MFIFQVEQGKKRLEAKKPKIEEKKPELGDLSKVIPVKVRTAFSEK